MSLCQHLLFHYPSITLCVVIILYPTSHLNTNFRDRNVANLLHSQNLQKLLVAKFCDIWWSCVTLIPLTTPSASNLLSSPSLTQSSHRFVWVGQQRTVGTLLPSRRRARQAPTSPRPCCSPKKKQREKGVNQEQSKSS